MRWLLVRTLWLVATLVGITAVTFVVVDAAPVDRAERAIAQAAPERLFPDARAREAAIVQLRIRHGMVDPVTLQKVPLWRRYARWLANAATLRFGGPGDDHDALWRRLGAAMPVTLLLGTLALFVAFGVGVPVGVWLGLRVGSRADRTAMTVLLLVASAPEYLAAILLTLAFSSLWLPWLPAAGLRTPGADAWSFGAQLLDFASHLVLPVLVMALGPLTLVTRFVRDAVARAERAPFVAAMRALGVDESVVRSRLVRHGCVPVATLVGSLLPMLVAGSLVVENVFALDGLGHLAFAAVVELQQPLLMAIVVLGSLITLAGLVLSDWLHRVVDARVRLS